MASLANTAVKCVEGVRQVVEQGGSTAEVLHAVQTVRCGCVRERGGGGYVLKEGVVGMF